MQRIESGIRLKFVNLELTAIQDTFKSQLEDKNSDLYLTCDLKFLISQLDSNIYFLQCSINKIKYVLIIPLLNVLSDIGYVI